eukprot:TRINITY_DN15281_c0_g1_i1.p1 TRINITY_DN15281_c0_g1~~TRINITY_DN15281_c0_g1_i1.p1  ORF type:complete len:229 (+),score=30.24 TRINITY_DN15281_c0_g1_i1:24-689(+)
MIRRPPRSTHCISSAASDVYKRQSHKLEISGFTFSSASTFLKTCTKSRTAYKRWPVILGRSESFSSSFCVQPLNEFPQSHVASVELVWGRINSPMKSVCTLPLPEVSTGISDVLISAIFVPERVVIYQELFIVYNFKNATAGILEVRIHMEGSQDFLLNGNAAGKLILPPYESDELRYTLLPLKAGKLSLPKLSVSVLNVEGMQIPRAQHSYESSIYVFSF